MNKIKKLIIIGDGGHSKVVQSIIKQTKCYQLIEIWDNIYHEELQKNQIWYRSIKKNNVKKAKNIQYFIAIGDNTVRAKIERQLDLSIDDYATIIHPNAVVDEQAIIRSGSLIMANVVVQTNSMIGHHSIVNTSAVVEHDTIIGDFVHIAPNVTITGNCDIKNCSFIGAGSILMPSISIGENSIIGAGSLVTKVLPNNIVAYGSPAKVIREEY